MKINEFKIGSVYTRSDLMSAFGGGFMRGINISKKTKSIILISKHYGKPEYIDRLINGFLHYTGEGLEGDQEMKVGNKAIRDADKNGYDIHLFLDMKPKEHTYYGVYKLVADPYMENANDINGHTRKVYKFILGKYDYIQKLTTQQLTQQVVSGPIKPVLDVVGACIEDDGKVLCAQRGYGSLINKWEFPGGKIEPGESPEDAIVREIKEELDIDVKVTKYLATSSYEYSDRVVNLSVYKCKKVNGEINDHEHKDLKWVKKDSMKALDWADADVPIVDTLLEEENYKIEGDPVKFDYLEIQKDDEGKGPDPEKDPRPLIDYERSMKSKAVSGAKAETAVLNYEKDKLLDLGRPELAAAVEQVSAISSDYGYDIKSFHYKDGKYVEHHIEVKKVTLTKNYISFFISANELNKFHTDENYSIYCVFKYGKAYKIHIIDKNLFASASVKPLNYQVKIKISEI